MVSPNTDPPPPPVPPDREAAPPIAGEPSARPLEPAPPPELRPGPPPPPVQRESWRKPWNRTGHDSQEDHNRGMLIVVLAIVLAIFLTPVAALVLLFAVCSAMNLR